MLQRIHEARRVLRIELVRWQLLRLSMLHAPNAAEVVVPVRPRGRIVRAVRGTARVVVNGRLVVKIDQVKRAVGTDARVDRAEPEVGAGDELGLLAAWFLAGDVSHAVRLQPIVVHEVDGGFGEEMRAVKTFRPGASIVDARSGGGREHANPVDLNVGRAGVLDRRENFLVIRYHGRRAETADVAARQNFFRHHDVQEMLAAGRGRVEHLAVRREVEAPGVARSRRDLLEHGAVGFETNDACGDAPEIPPVRRFGIACAVADGAVNPAVHAPAEIIDDRVGVAGAETRVEHLDLVRDAVAVGVANPEDVRRLGDDDAVLVKHERGHQFESAGNAMRDGGDDAVDVAERYGLGCGAQRQPSPERIVEPRAGWRRAGFERHERRAEKHPAYVVQQSFGDVFAEGWPCVLAVQ